MVDGIRTDVEILKRDMEMIASLAGKFDVAIDKLSAVSVTVDKMLAVHETRLQNNEQQREILHQRISDMKKEITEEFKSLKEENRKQHSQTNERLEKLERWRWFVVGVATVIGFSLAQMESLGRIFG
jgi:chromosome segregation ATPase|tara:strand:+ start:949 stop:1329 length:381 start_codon:yes stop_codon:yes gene_type:complete